MRRINQLAYQEKFLINEIEQNGQRKDNIIMIPYTDEPDIGIDDVIKQLSGQRKIEFKVLDCQFGKNQSLSIGTKHPHILKLQVEHINAEKNNTKQASTSFNITNLNGTNIQLGDGNTQNFINIIKELEDKIDKAQATPQEKEEAKGLLWQLMDNKLVNTVVGTLASNAIKSE
ncbi:hypothetical protein H5087_09050 [Pseudoalteromonas sp. SR43-7]|uniref:hypothetical protein n=1 Tax=Pseudoalteromonas sp. SR43-7 TaxID=2760939 RepID=UPI0015F97EB9|nr:hypothetical protein [Pseudoalteromonas sp. SR43-7]MBB1329493.1 hypothetical protein [Pseudoalteromonas sp. SR43-7]